MNAPEITNGPETVNLVENLHADEAGEMVKLDEQAPTAPVQSALAPTAPVTTEAVPTEPNTAEVPIAIAATAVVPAATAQNAPQRPPLELIAAGTFSPDLFSNAPAAAVKRFILTRAGFAPGSPEVSHLPDVRLDNPDKTLSRLPEVFPPADWPEEMPLQSVADWLACVDACQVAPPPAEDAK